VFSNALYFIFCWQIVFVDKDTPLYFLCAKDFARCVRNILILCVYTLKDLCDNGHYLFVSEAAPTTKIVRFFKNYPSLVKQKKRLTKKSHSSVEYLIFAENNTMRLLLLSILLVTSSFVNAQQTYVPDNNFEAFLENNGMGNGIPNDDYVTTANISGVGSLICWGWNIADLTGIEDFTSLSTLYCFDNPLTTLDITQNTGLTDLRCNNTQLTSLDVTQNTSLVTFFCYDNYLTSLDLSQNTILNDLRCFDNLITSLDLSQNPGLSFLRCYNNNLTSINVTQCPQLEELNCKDNDLTALDVSQNPALTSLFCYDNDLTTLNLLQNPALTDLRCHNNFLTALDVSQNTLLTIIFCQNNNLTSLDVSQNAVLTYLSCQDNQLLCLVANNGVNIDMDCSNNQLFCISVVNPNWSYANTIYDAGISFEVICQTFMDNDVSQNGVVLTADQNSATYQWLDCDNNYAVIGGATSQTYSANSSGSYAVEITFTSCTGTQADTSMCAYVDCQSEINNDVNQNGSVLSAEQSGATYQWLDCENGYIVISGETNQSYDAANTGYFAVEITVTDACGGVQVDTSSCHLVAYADIKEFANEPLELVKIVDFLGRETPFKPNTQLIYIYSDGTTDRVFKLEE